jgi:hypothetical protein
MLLAPSPDLAQRLLQLGMTLNKVDAGNIVEALEITSTLYPELKHRNIITPTTAKLTAPSYPPPNKLKRFSMYNKLLNTVMH